MPPYEKPAKIDAAFVQGLIDRKQPESKHFEFKQQIDFKSTDDKRKMIERATAFANTDGGFLVYGIKESEGKADSFFGTDCPYNDDELKQTVEHLFRSWANPSLVDAEIEPVLTSSGKRALVVHVPESESKLHEVTKGGPIKIYRRHSSGIYEPRFAEIKQLITASEQEKSDLKEKTDFRQERIDSISSGQLPVSMEKELPLFVLHCIPKGIGASRKDFEEFRSAENFSVDTKGYYRGGYISLLDYTFFYRVFRDGCVEIVYTLSPKDTNEVYATLVENLFSQSCVPRLLDCQTKLRLSAPHHIYLSLLNIGGYKLSLTPDEEFNLPFHTEPEMIRPIVEQDLLVSGIQIASTKWDIQSTMDHMCPAFDFVWRSCGWSGSCNYNDEGKWRGFKWLHAGPTLP